jgi:hypothetical protein
MVYQRCGRCGARHYSTRVSSLPECPSCGQSLARRPLTEERVRAALYPRSTAVERGSEQPG